MLEDLNYEKKKKIKNSLVGQKYKQLFFSLKQKTVFCYFLALLVEHLFQVTPKVVFLFFL